MKMVNSKIKTAGARDPRNWRDIFRRSRAAHDPMLVFNMSIFNFEGGWSRIFNQITPRENN